MLGLWLGELLRHVDGLKLKEDEDLVQCSKSCGWECPHGMPMLVLRMRMAEEQMCEGFVGLDLIARYGCRVRPLGHPIHLPVQKREEIPQGSSSA